MTQSTRTVAAQELQSFKAAFFKALAHPIRIRILERLVGRTTRSRNCRKRCSSPSRSSRSSWRCCAPTTWCPARKSGTTVSYAVRDPLIGDLLDVARRIFNNHLVGTQGLLKTLQRSGADGSAGVRHGSDTGQTRVRHGSDTGQTRVRPCHASERSSGRRRLIGRSPASSPARH